MLVLRSAYASAHTCARPHRARLLGSSLRWAESGLVSNPAPSLSLVFSLIRLTSTSTSTSFLSSLLRLCLVTCSGSCLRASGLVSYCRNPRPSPVSPLPGVVSRSLSRPPSFPVPVCPGSSRPYIQFTPRPHRDLFSLLHTLRLFAALIKTSFSSCQHSSISVSLAYPACSSEGAVNPGYN